MLYFYNKPMKTVFSILFTAFCPSRISGCSFIAGIPDEEQTVLVPFRLSFIESLRDQKSLRGESFREFAAAGNVGPSLKRPNSVFADQFRVYVTDKLFACNCLYLRSRGRHAEGVAAQASDELRLVEPTGITVDGAGIIYVSDGQQGRVFGFDRMGQLLFVLGRAQALVSQRGLGELVWPAGLAVDNERNRLYVADTQAQQVKVFDTMGMHLFDIGSTGRGDEDFKFPAAVSVDRAGRVYVLDSLRLRVFVFDPEGVFLSSFSLKGAVPGQPVKPKGLAVDSAGHIYIVDIVNNNVLIFNPDGTLAMTWGRTGRLNGDFLSPAGIFIDSRDYVYIADQSNSRIQTYQFTK